MDEKLKKRWINALKSGKYSQTREYLKCKAFYEEEYDEESHQYVYRVGDKIVDQYDDVPTGYCCLGVLCDIAPGIEEDNGAFKITQKSLVKLFHEEDLDRWEETEEGSILINGEQLPFELEKHLGLDKIVTHNGRKMRLQEKLISMNDDGVPFDQIAKYLEKVKF